MPPPESVVFTEQQFADNYARVLRLADLVRSGEAVAIVGAGSSVSAGYPDWDTLLAKLTAVAEVCSPGFINAASTGDKLLHADAIRDCIAKARGPEYFDDELGRIFAREPDLTPFHHDLLSLPFRGFGTTNYDATLQVAAVKSGRAATLPLAVPVWNGDPRHLGGAIRALSEQRSLEHIVHLHGVCGSPRTIVLAAADYKSAYGFEIAASLSVRQAPFETTRLQAVLSSLLSMRRVVFVGFSLDDPFVSTVLGVCVRRFWEWDRAVHFAIMPITAERAETDRLKAERLKRELAIETVFYEAVQRDHSERDKLLTEVRRLVSAGRTDAPYLPTPATAGPSPVGETTKLSWVTVTNEAHQKKGEGT